MTEAQAVRQRVRAFRLNRPRTEAQLLFPEGIWHFRSDGHAHWWRAGGKTPGAEPARFWLVPRRKLLVVVFADGSALLAQKTWLGPRIRARASAPAEPAP